MDETKKAESNMSSAAAFVEGGIQESCDDSCSICLEGFSDSDPSTVTSCKHDFHLQCILEWCQRSSNCPMCWQNISLKDPLSQELFEAVERERSIRLTPSRNTTIFRHPTFGDFELQHLPVGMDSAELEERIIQHLAAAAMGRTHRAARREGSRSRSSAHAHPQYVVISAQSPESSTGAGEEENEPASEIENNIGTQHMPSFVQSNHMSASSPRASVTPTSSRGLLNDNRNYMNESYSPSQDRAGPSEFQSFPDTWKSRFSSISMKYKESIAKGTKELKEKLFSRSSSMADISTEVRREVNAGIATVSRMMERLESRDNNPAGPSNNSTDTVDDVPASSAASSISS